MNYYEYKGYIGTIEVSTEDGVLYGTVNGINDLVMFESESMSEIENEFRNAVDHYLALCETLGKDPDKSYKGQFNVRISPELHKKIALQAVKENVTLNKIVEQSMELYMEDKENLVVKKLDEIKDKVDECVKVCNKENKETWDGAKESYIRSGSVEKNITDINQYKLERAII